MIPNEILNLSPKELESLRVLLKILDNIREAILLIDEEGRILFFNEQFKKFFAVKKSEKNSTLFLKDVIKDEGFYGIVKDVFSKGEEVRAEFEVSFPESRILSVTGKLVVLPLKNQDKKTALFSFYNITRLKRLEQMKTDFVAAVSHEIKTPITAIKGFAETLLEGALNDEKNATKFLQIIKKHSERLNSLVEDLLILSAIELGELKIKKAKINLVEVIDTVITTLEEKAKKKGLYLRKEFVGNDRPIILADRDKLIQILINLVDNGIKFTEKGGVTIRYEEAVPCIRVIDTGIGIPKEHLPRLGERFYRVDKARSRELGGTGLGLAIVKHFVKAHGWQMTIESEVGKGTEVKLTLI